MSSHPSQAEVVCIVLIAAYAGTLGALLVLLLWDSGIIL